MTNVTLRSAKRLLGALGLLLGAALLPTAASAGVATAGAVLLDPFDPVPAIQFHHFGGYGCNESCGGYRHRHRERCDDGCRVAERHHHDCDRECDGSDRGTADNSGPVQPPPCAEGRCFDIQHWEHNWRQGDRVGQAWQDTGYRVHNLDHGAASPGWFGKHPDRTSDSDEDPPPPPPPPTAPDATGHDHHLVCIGLCFGWRK